MPSPSAVALSSLAANAPSAPAPFARTRWAHTSGPTSTSTPAPPIIVAPPPRPPASHPAARNPSPGPGPARRDAPRLLFPCIPSQRERFHLLLRRRQLVHSSIVLDQHLLEHEPIRSRQRHARQILPTRRPEQVRPIRV